MNHLIQDLTCDYLIFRWWWPQWGSKYKPKRFGCLKAWRSDFQLYHEEKVTISFDSLALATVLLTVSWISAFWWKVTERTEGNNTSRVCLNKTWLKGDGYEKTSKHVIHACVSLHDDWLWAGMDTHTIQVGSDAITKIWSFIIPLTFLPTSSLPYLFLNLYMMIFSHSLNVSFDPRTKFN